MSENLYPTESRLESRLGSRQSKPFNPREPFNTNVLHSKTNMGEHSIKQEISVKQEISTVKQESSTDKQESREEISTVKQETRILQEIRPVVRQGSKIEKTTKQPKRNATAEQPKHKSLTARKTRKYNELDHPNDLEGYEKLSKIGEGTYGVVFKAKQKATNELVALKKIHLNLQEGVPTTTIREVAILKSLNHENIITLRDMIQRDAIVYLVFDYADMDLKRYMDRSRRKGISAAHIKSFMHQILRGLHYCHAHRIIHRDLKPQNLLIDRHGRLTIADLGLSRAYGVPMRTYTHQVVTLWYRAPEILLGSKHYSTAVDMWSVGCIMAELMSLSPLFPGSSQIDQLFRIFQKLGTPSEAVWPGVSTLKDYNENFPPWPSVELRDIVERSKYAIDLPDSAYDLLQQLLTYDPVSRISATRAEDHFYFFDDITTLAF